MKSFLESTDLYTLFLMLMVVCGTVVGIVYIIALACVGQLHWPEISGKEKIMELYAYKADDDDWDVDGPIYHISMSGGESVFDITSPDQWVAFNRKCFDGFLKDNPNWFYFLADPDDVPEAVL